MSVVSTVKVRTRSSSKCLKQLLLLVSFILHASLSTLWETLQCVEVSAAGPAFNHSASFIFTNELSRDLQLCRC